MLVVYSLRLFFIHSVSPEKHKEVVERHCVQNLIMYGDEKGGMRSEFCSDLTSSLSDWGWLTVVDIGLGGTRNIELEVPRWCRKGKRINFSGSQPEMLDDICTEDMDYVRVSDSTLHDHVPEYQSKNRLEVIALDVDLPVKQAFHILYEQYDSDIIQLYVRSLKLRNFQGISTAPLWDFSKGQFVGVCDSTYQNIVPGTASDIFAAVKDVGANVIMISQASGEHSVCFAVPEKEVEAVATALEARFQQALSVGRLSQV
ncbi:bifunctional aspartokinase/homoserine dehydrogenase 1, chloroplastic-like protein [Tanacetum coccineum]